MEPSNEHWIVVEGWDDQTGGWFTIDEAQNEGQAAEMVSAFRQDEANSRTQYYAIVTHDRKVLRPPE